jgi:hypothetical protein
VDSHLKGEEEKANNKSISQEKATMKDERKQQEAS